MIAADVVPPPTKLKKQGRVGSSTEGEGHTNTHDTGTTLFPVKPVLSWRHSQSERKQG